MNKSSPRTVQELIDWFEANFVCFTISTGRAFFEIQPSKDELFRFVFRTYAYKLLLGGPTIENEDIGLLVEAMHDDFASLEQTPAWETSLFWRLPERIVLAVEPCADGNGLVATLRTRLFIPAAEWAAPPLPCCLVSEGVAARFIDKGRA
jgi:hypothetical protein